MRGTKSTQSRHVSNIEVIDGETLQPTVFFLYAGTVSILGYECALNEWNGIGMNFEMCQRMVL